jgi:hypothetical protein
MTWHTDTNEVLFDSTIGEGKDKIQVVSLNFYIDREKPGILYKISKYFRYIC